MFYQLPPAGNPVTLSEKPEVELPAFFASVSRQFYASGTAALAAAICAAKKIKNTQHAEVILPAYACPDLVSAVVYAGAKPVLVDIEENTPWLDLPQLAAAINSNTVALVAVNLFGISERWPQLQNLCSQHEIILIEDSAQYFPAADEEIQWFGDLVVFSFGRGKPVSLLGGGAVITGQKTLFDTLPVAEKAEFSLLTRIKMRTLFAVKVRLYNAMISPFVYWLPQALPFLHLGETRYHVLSDIEALSDEADKKLTANMFRYQHDAAATERCKKLSDMLPTTASLVNLPRHCQMPENRRLLRYPVLLDPALRESVFADLSAAGLGVSRMYPQILPEIDGLQDMFTKTDFPNARAFCAAIITLPTHEKLSDTDIKKMRVIFLKHHVE